MADQVEEQNQTKRKRAKALRKNLTEESVLALALKKKQYLVWDWERLRKGIVHPCVPKGSQELPQHLLLPELIQTAQPTPRSGWGDFVKGCARARCGKDRETQKEELIQKPKIPPSQLAMRRR